MFKALAKDRLSQIALIGFILLTIWWLILNIFPSSDSAKYLFGAIYGSTMSLYGGLVGIYVSGQWGGNKSVMGKAIIFLSLGLLAQAFGQLANSAYNIILQVETVYPGLADIGYFGNIPLYTIGIFLLAQASGAKISLKQLSSKLFALILPCLLLVATYLLFLQHYEFDWSQPLLILLDFGYPLGQAFYVSIAVLTYILSKDLLGGMMKRIIFMILAAFVIQYFSDFSFLLTNSQGNYFVGGFVDYLYLLSYTLMALSIFELRLAALKIRNSEATPQ